MAWDIWILNSDPILCGVVVVVTSPRTLRIMETYEKTEETDIAEALQPFLPLLALGWTLAIALWWVEYYFTSLGELLESAGERLYLSLGSSKNSPWKRIWMLVDCLGGDPREHGEW